MKPKRRCTFPAPSRVWFKTAEGGWTSRDWLAGRNPLTDLNEKEEYELEVLGRQPE